MYWFLTLPKERRIGKWRQLRPLRLKRGERLLKIGCEWGSRGRLDRLHAKQRRYYLDARAEACVRASGVSQHASICINDRALGEQR